MDQHQLRAPGDGGLRRGLEAARRAVAAADPLAAALLGGPLELPRADRDAEAAALAGLHDALAGLERIPGLADAGDELDRLALVHGLRRAVDGARADEPAGPALLERHLQLRLLRLLDRPDDGLEALADLVDLGPVLLRHARRDPGRGDRCSGLLALESARRMPVLIDACAGAAREADMPLRLRLEAGLGPLLQACAEESGWLLREYLPVAPPLPEPAPLDVRRAGLGLGLAEIESLAEAALADAVAREDATTESEPAATVAAAWEQAAAAAQAHWGLAAPVEAMLTPAPGWLVPLVTGLSLVDPGALSGAPIRLLVGPGTAAPMLDAAREVYEADFLPAAHQHAGGRPARLLLPSPDLGLGWRAAVREGAPGAASWRVELAWRASLALAAVAMARGQVGVEQAGGLIAAESGISEEQALLQAGHLALRPLPALSFIAGRELVARFLRASGAAGAGRLLAASPLPAAAIDGLARTA